MRPAGVLLAAALAAAAVRAATVQDAPPQAQAPVDGGGVLERALQVDTEAPQRNDQLLIETRETGLTEAVPTAPRSRPLLQDSPVTAIRPAADPPPAPGAAIPGPVREAVDFLRAHRVKLAGAAAAVAVLVLAGALWRHRRTATTQRQLQALDADRRVASSGRRRRHSSRH